MNVPCVDRERLDGIVCGAAVNKQQREVER